MGNRPSKFEIIEIHNSFIKLERKKEEKGIQENNKDKPWLKLLSESQKKISFDFEGALDYCKNEISKKDLLSALHGEMSINEIRNEIFRGVLDSNGRYYHNYSSLNRQLRQFASFNGMKLVKIDVTSSHLCLMTRLYTKECPEKQAFISVLKEGRFYEMINSALGNAFDLSDDEERGSFKREFFQFALFSPEGTGKKEVEKKKQKQRYRAAFSKAFPILAFEVERLRNEKGHKFLPNHLMHIEAKIMIDGVVRRLHGTFSGQEAIVLSLHDCIVTEARLVSVVNNLIMEEYCKVLGFSPHLKTDIF